MKSAFFDKLIDRMDRLDPQSIQTHFLKLARERGLLEMIFQSMQEGVMVIDGSGRLTYANRAAEQLMGFSLENAKGRPVSRFFHDVDWDLILAGDDSEWSKLVSREVEIAYPRRRILNFYVVPLAVGGSNGSDDGALMMFRDVTRDRDQEADLVESERIDAVKLLAAGVAHEIGNPLNALNIHLQLIERELGRLSGEAAEDLKELVQVARTEATRLDLIITQFLRAIRPAKPDPVMASVDDLVKETLGLLRHEIENRKVGVALDFSETPAVPVDRDQMKQAFFNVIRNAVQAMPDGGALTISLSVRDGFLAVSFRDTGVGIVPEEMGGLFEPYRTTKPDGSGLGLMIVQRIVQDHGGQIEIRSKPEEGTVVTLLLPLAERRVRLLKASRTDGSPPAREPNEDLE